MTRITVRALKSVVAFSTIAGIVAVTSSGARAILLDVYFLCMGAVALLALVRITRLHAEPPRTSPFDVALAGMGRAPPDSGELSLARDLELSTYNAFHLHVRVRPMLRDIAAHRLRSRYGIELDVEPARAQELVGSAAWELVRPEREPPRDRMAAGPTIPGIRLVVDELEAI